MKIIDMTEDKREVTDIGDGQYKLMCKNQVKNSEDTIILGKGFSELTPDGGTVKATIKIEDGIKKHIQVGNGKSTTEFRERLKAARLKRRKNSIVKSFSLLKGDYLLFLIFPF